MSIRKKLIIGFSLVLLSTVLFAGLRPQKCADGICTIHSNSDYLYSQAGQYNTGLRTITIGAEPPLEMTIWYPAASGAGEVSYPYEIKIGATLGAVTIADTPGLAVPDAAYDRRGAPYPLVVLSPGFAMGAQAYGWLAEHLASYGFVVVAPEHQETLDPGNELWRTAVARPRDIQELYAYLDEAAAPGGELAGLVDPENTAVIGHSYGGYTALAAAGARIDTAGFTANCAEAAQTDDPLTWLCDMLLPRLPEMAGLAGLAGVPAALWPDWSAARVDAIVPMAGDAYFFGQSGLAGVAVPLLAIGGTLDDDTPFRWGPQPAFDHATGPRKGLAALTDAEHMMFTNVCASVRWYAIPLAGEFCNDAVWERAAAHTLISHLTTAFLLAELKQDTAAAAALAPKAVVSPHLTYRVEGY